MDRAAELCERDRSFLTAFSRLVLDRLTGASARFLPVPFVNAFLRENVAKETEKDRLIIERAMAACNAGRPIADDEIDAVFEATKAADRKFLHDLPLPSPAAAVRYDEIADIRRLRIRRIFRMVYDLVPAWTDGASFAHAVRTVYSEERFRETLREILELYNLETRKLGAAITLFPPFSLAVDLLTDRLFDCMETAARDLAADCAQKLFAGEGVHAEG